MQVQLGIGRVGKSRSMSLGARIEGNIEGERQQIEIAEPTVA
jgi:hypothetical protein